MIKYEVHLTLQSKESDNKDIQDSKVVIFNPDEPVLINGDILEYIPAKYLEELTPYDSVLEWTMQDGKILWRVEEIKVVNF